MPDFLLPGPTYLVALDPCTDEVLARTQLVRTPTMSNPHPLYPRTAEEITVPAGSILQLVEEREYV